MKSLFLVGLVVLSLALGLAWAGNSQKLFNLTLGPQRDGTFIVSTGQRIRAGSIAFPQRLSDLALHPDGRTVAVVAKSKVFLVSDGRILQKDGVAIGANAGFHGAVWSPDGRKLYLSTDAGHVQEFSYAAQTLTATRKLDLRNSGSKVNPVPGGMCVSNDGAWLYVACVNLGGVALVNLESGQREKLIKTQNLPFTVRLAEGETKLVVSNWGGEPPKSGDLTDKSEDVDIKVTKDGSAATGTVSIVDLKTEKRHDVQVGIHPTGIAVQGRLAYVANSLSDSISVVNLTSSLVEKTIPILFGGKKVLGAMPNELAISGNTLYSCDGGDNALCEIDLKTSKVKGYRPAGYFPTGVAISSDERQAFVVNTKGNGSVRNTLAGSNKRNTHDFQGTLSYVDLGADLKKETEVVSEFNSWSSGSNNDKPNMAVFKGAIKHVIYVIKENRTYDEIFGDLPIGNGDPELCSLGEKVMPNHRKLAREFGLFDNGYTSGTNSADGHQWCDQAMANEYLEHFYVGYSRTYPDDGEDAMALNPSGRIWDAAIAAKKSVRVYGEWAGDDQAEYQPRPPKDWFEAWEDRVSGANVFRYKAHTRVNSLKPILCPDYHYWPLIQSDQGRIDVFEREFKAFEREGQVPNLMVMSLPSDHSEGLDPKYPTPRSMMADNDLALGRLVDTVSHSSVWKETCIFVVQDDSQGGPDHVDGHRSLFLAISPYSRRGRVNSEFMTHISILKTIEIMLGLKPMTRFDTVARPLVECFSDKPDLTPYSKTANNVPLGERNPSKDKLTTEDKKWADISASLDWSGIDRADWYWLNRIVWYSIHKGAKPYPDRAHDMPGIVESD